MRKTTRALAVAALATFVGVGMTQAAPFSQPPVLVQAVDSSDGHQNFHFFDQARFEHEYLSVIQARDHEAYEYLFAATEALHGSFRDLIQVISDLQQLSDQGLTQPVFVPDYLSLVRSFNQLTELLEDKISALALFPELKESVRTELSATVNFEPLQTHYQKQLARLRERSNTITVRLTLPSGHLYEQTGLDASQLRGMQLYSASQINNLKRQAFLKKIKTPQDQEVINQGINTFTQKALEQYIDSFGTSERYRTSSDSKGRMKAAQDLMDAFWARFYIRAVYGIKIGSIPVDYTKRIFNLDYLLSDVRIGVTPLWTDDHLKRALNLATEAKATLYDKNARMLTSAVRNFSNWILGHSAAENAKRLMIGLVTMDLEQEISLGRVDGLRAVRDDYRLTYYVTEQDRVYYKKMEKLVFGDDGDDPEADVGVIDAGTLKSAIRQCTHVLEMLEVNMEEARKLEDTVVELTRDYQTIQKRKRRAQML